MDSEASLKAQEMSEETVGNFEYLRQQCQINGNAILERWKEKNEEQRRKIILEIDP